MSFAALHTLIAYVMAALGLYALTLGGELGALTTVAVTFGVVASLFVRAETFSRPGWIRGWNVAVVGFFVLEVARGVLGESLLGLGVEYAAFLQVSRLFNRRTARDHQQIAVLAFLHLIAATVLSTSLTYAFLFLAFLIVTPWMLTLSQLRREVEGYYPGEGESIGPGARRVLASKRVIGPGFLLGTAALALPIFAVTGAFFLLFPRVGMGFLAFGSDSGRRVAGFGANVELGDFGVIRDDPTVVLRVYPDPGLATPPVQVDLRLRGTSFDRYDGSRWSRAARRSRPIGRYGDQYPIVRFASSADRDVRIVLDHLEESVVFLPDNTVAITIPPRVQGGYDTGRQIAMAPGIDVRYLDDDELGLSYVAHVGTAGPELLTSELDDEERLRLTALPPGSARLVELARGLTREADTDEERARAVLAFLRDSGTFRYSLELPALAGRDPLEVFLFEARRGHCEYFSTAMAILLRAVGVPTRNVTGFLGGTYNPYGGYYALRQGDAHSWLEAYHDGRWVTYDPTPAGRVDAAPAGGLLSDLRAMLDAARTRWNEHVVGYDMRAQVDGLRRLYRTLRALGGDDPEAPEAGEVEAPASLGGRAAPYVGAAVAVALLSLLLLRRRRAGPTRRRRRRLEPAAHEATRLYRDLERALARRGRPRPPARTPVEHARALTGEAFAGAPEVEEITRRYVEARFGEARLSTAELARLRALVACVRHGADA